MEQNVGKTDKIIRWIAAVVFAVLAFKYSYWFLILTAVLAFTAATGHCGPYKLFGINTCSECKTKSAKVTKSKSKKK